MPLALVTGGSGFVGRHLTELLLKRGDAVRVLDKNTPPAELPGAEIRLGSILDPAAVNEAMRGVDIVYHLAGIAHLWVRDKADFDRINHQGTKIVLHAAAESRIARIVHCSTESILLPRHRKALIDEATPPPLEDMPGPYTRSKHRGERIALQAAKDGLNVVVVNPTVPIGAGDTNMTPPAAMLALFLSGGTPFFLDCTLNLVDVRNAAEGIALAGEKGRAGERYILGGENVAMRDLLRTLERISGRRMPRRAVPAALAQATASVSDFISNRLTGNPPAATREGVVLAMRSAPFDCGKAGRELGYKPASIEQALTEAVQAFKRK